MAKQEEKKTVLIPVLSRQESNPGFLKQATADFDQAIILVVIDTSDMVGQFGFMAHEIRQATALVESIKTVLQEQGKKAEEIVEWGHTVQKICQMAEIRECEKIALARQENEYFKKLLGQLEQGTTKKIEAIAVAVPEPKKA